MQLHRVKGQFGADTGVSMKLYHREDKWSWCTLDAIHLLINHRSYRKLYLANGIYYHHTIFILCFFTVLLDPSYKDYPVFDEKNVRNYPYQFGEMAREILES